MNLLENVEEEVQNPLELEQVEMSDQKNRQRNLSAMEFCLEARHRIENIEREALEMITCSTQQATALEKVTVSTQTGSLTSDTEKERVISTDNPRLNLVIEYCGERKLRSKSHGERKLRSKGPVEEIQWVQSQTLERRYQRKRKI